MSFKSVFHYGMWHKVKLIPCPPLFPTFVALAGRFCNQICKCYFIPIWHCFKVNVAQFLSLFNSEKNIFQFWNWTIALWTKKVLVLKSNSKLSLSIQSSGEETVGVDLFAFLTLTSMWIRLSEVPIAFFAGITELSLHKFFTTAVFIIWCTINCATCITN